MKSSDLGTLFGLKEKLERLERASKALCRSDVNKRSEVRICRESGGCLDEVWLDNEIFRKVVSFEIESTRKAMMEIGVEFSS